MLEERGILAKSRRRKVRTGSIHSDKSVEHEEIVWLPRISELDIPAESIVGGNWYSGEEELAAEVLGRLQYAG